MNSKRSPPRRERKQQSISRVAAAGEKPVPPKEESEMQNSVIKYEDTTSQYAIDEYLRRWHRDTERAYKWKQRRLRVTKQRVIGFILLLLTVPAITLLEGDATIAVITVPVGAALIFSA